MFLTDWGFWLGLHLFGLLFHSGIRRIRWPSCRSSRPSHQCQGLGPVTLDWIRHQIQRVCCMVPGCPLTLVFWLGRVLSIMALLIAVIARDFRSISSTGTVLTSPFWGFLLGFFPGFSGLASVGLKGVGLKGVSLGDILLTFGRASLSMPLPSLTRLFLFSSSFSGGFWLAGRQEVGPCLRSCGFCLFGLIIPRIEAYL